MESSYTRRVMNLPPEAIRVDLRYNLGLLHEYEVVACAL